MDCAVGHVVDERAVVRDKHHRVGFLLQEIFKPLYGFYIQMVGRLVEEQQVRMLKQEFGKLDAHAPPAAELRSHPAEILPYKTESNQRLLDFSLVIVAFFQEYVVVKLGHAVY